MGRTTIADHFLKKSALVVFALGFLITSLALIWHHHDISIKWSTCAICKVKNAQSGLTSKNKIDATNIPVIALNHTDSIGDFSSCFLMLSMIEAVLVALLLSIPYANKAPPSLSSF